jgi:hypothetical protein
MAVEMHFVILCFIKHGALTLLLKNGIHIQKLRAFEFLFHKLSLCSGMLRNVMSLSVHAAGIRLYGQTDKA